MAEKKQDEQWLSLNEWVIKTIKAGKANDPGFQVAKKVWGVEKFNKIWEDYLASEDVRGDQK